MAVIAALLVIALAAALAPWAQSWMDRRTGLVLATVPAAVLAGAALLAPGIAGGEALVYSVPWVPALGLAWSVYLDGLGLLFVCLISGIGAVVLIYAGAYLAGHPQLGRLYMYLLLFMAAMLGLVTAGNLLALFVFWELTSICSYLLVGFDHEREAARKAALQALLVTGVGGLALLAGLILLASVTGTYEFADLLRRSEGVRSHSWYGAILALVVLGAFTKSAQVPFHFWLPGAMEAPTPVSAYLHSATMVKAGVYLLARLSPLLGGTPAWHYGVAVGGAVTMLAGVVLCMFQSDLKRLLAYSTVSALGTLVFMVGLDTTLSMQAAMVLLIAHSLYKGTLFMVAGSLDHEAGTRDIRQLGGMCRAMPITAAAAVLAGLSMAGAPPLLGFIGKELVYEAKLEAPQAGLYLTVAGVLANVLMVTTALLIVWKPFFGRRVLTARAVHEAPPAMWLGPLLLGGLGAAVAMFADGAARFLVGPAVSAVRAEPTQVALALWHGLNPILVLSVVTIAAGVVVFTQHGRLVRLAAPLRSITTWGPACWYTGALTLVFALARGLTARLQTGSLRTYLLVVLLTTVVIGGLSWAPGADAQSLLRVPDLRPYEVLLAAAMVLAAFGVVRATSRLSAVIALGALGTSMAVVFALYGGPDLAMTQFAVETLTAVFFMLVLYRLPHPEKLSTRMQRLRDAAVAFAVGALITVVLLAATRPPHGASLIASYFAQHSLSLAKGRNVVNVIVVDFRALDTLGEITVLVLAAVGVYALVRLRLGER
jgi:multicomponent Na+:H+ antiporter subunit A